MKKFFKLIRSVFKAYDYSDKLVSVMAFAVLLLMFVKMMLFPYGFFGFGDLNIYTEGIVARNGIQNLNPLFVDYNEADREVSRVVFSGLMKYDPSNKAIVDDMAKLTINEDKTEYTLTMRKGLKWQDGKEVTATDAYFTFHDLILAEDFPNQILKANFAGVEIEKIDEYTIKFKLEKPNIFFLSNLTVGLLPEHLLKGISPAELLKDPFNKKPVGTGPYFVDEAIEKFSGGRMQVTLERSPYYYDEIPQIEHLRFLIYPDMEELMEDANAVNGVVKVTGEYKEFYEKNERFELLPYELPQYTAVFMNLDSPILKDKVEVRRALQKSLDKSALLKQLDSKVAVDTPLMELKENDSTFKPDLDAAKEALYDAGYRYAAADKEKKGVRYDADGKPLELLMIARLYDEGTYQFEETKKVVGFLQRSWRNAGFSIKIELMDELEFEERIMNRKYDLLLIGHNLGYNLDTYSYWHSTQANPLGQNFSNYKSFMVDSLIEDIRSVFNVEKRERELQELSEQLKADIPAIFLYRPIYYYASDEKIEGLSMKGVVFPSDRFAGVSRWKFKEE